MNLEQGGSHYGFLDHYSIEIARPKGPKLAANNTKLLPIRIERQFLPRNCSLMHAEHLVSNQVPSPASSAWVIAGSSCMKNVLNRWWQRLPFFAGVLKHPLISKHNKPAITK